MLLDYSICFHETGHNKWCLHKNVRQTENGLQRGFVKHWLNPVKSAYEVKNDLCLFECPFKIQKNGVFLFEISFFFLEISTFFHYANLISDDVILFATKMWKILNKRFLWKYWSGVLKTWHHKCTSQKKQNDNNNNNNNIYLNTIKITAELMWSCI